ncbi:hypothetical protein [Pseudokineococcus lusitanus]|uniref:Uncharacterized protein n=1 Tax=Pseudokineococcus lusitanus TaxID=763993 RepID=A0A3N1HU60_9ACTN|nr:hypothetical protein [Pseudokineococcus lusitanus]ROP45892.1 hypothetical protein EDC03_0504 [Pseudokineococcus lusitanus]
MSAGPVGPAAAPSTLLDLTGLPTAVRTRAQRWQVIGAGGLTIGGALGLVRDLPADDGGAVLRASLDVVVLVAGLALTVLARRARLVLETGGVRTHDGLRPGALTPWSDVVAVQPPTPTSPHAVLILDEPGPGGHVDLLGVRPEVARELQRRLEAARERSDGGVSR